MDQSFDSSSSIRRWVEEAKGQRYLNGGFLMTCIETTLALRASCICIIFVMLCF